MKLNENDYYEIEALMNADGGTAEYVKDGDTLFFDYKCDVVGYVEDDFTCGRGNGTGAFIPSSAEVRITNVGCYDEDGNETECNFDAARMAAVYESALMTY